LYRVVVLTDPDNAGGFRLAGVDVEVADSIAEARTKLASMLDDDETGIIAMNERLTEAIDDRLAKKIESIYRPIVVSLPLREKLEAASDHQAYLARLIRRAIGFDITLRRG
jgi:V/A-type H+-transporting ATPase subunit F